MAGWLDPRPNDFSTEGLRARFKSLQDWLRSPEFAEGFRLGDGTPAVYDGATGVTVPPALAAIDSGTFDALDQALSGLQSDLDTLNNTTLPGLDARLDIAEADVAQALLEGVTVVTSLPTLPNADYPSGKVVYLQATGENKLYRNVSGTWSAATPTTDLTGQITETQITNDAITTPKIAAGAVTATEIATNAVTTDKILAGAVTAGKIAADAVTATEIAAGTITSAEIAAGTITANEIAAGTITANEIAAGTITANELGANSVTANELAALELEVGKYIRSTTYTPGSAGWAIDADGSAEFNDVTVRGEVTATEFHGADTVNGLTNGTFDVNTTGWTAGTSTSIARVTSPVRSGAGALRVARSSGTGDVSTSVSVTAAPKQLLHFQAWVRKEAVAALGSLAYQNAVSVSVEVLDGGVVAWSAGAQASVAATASDWTLLECYYPVPDSDGVYTPDEVRFTIGAWADGTKRLFVDDVTIGEAPLLEVPYMTTHEDSARRRTLILPGQVGFDLGSDYPYGMSVRDLGDSRDLRLAGPFSGSDAAQIVLGQDFGSGKTTLDLSAQKVTLNNKPMFYGFTVTHGNQSLTHNKNTLLTGWGTPQGDADGWMSSDRFTVPSGYTGLLLAVAQVRFASNATGYRFVSITGGGGVGTRYAGTMSTAISGNISLVPAVMMRPVSGGESFSVGAFQNSGDALNVENANSDTRLSVMFFGLPS